MKKWLSIFALASCLLFASSCARLVIVKPDLWPSPHLTSMVTMPNAKTKEPGFWFDRKDANTLGEFLEHNNNLIKSY